MPSQSGSCSSLYAISLSLAIIAIFDILKAKANLSKVSDFILNEDIKLKV